MNKLFYVTDVENTHVLIYFLGIKLKVLKKHIKKRKNVFPKGTDITKIPPAEGLLRQLQLAELSLIKEVDEVCSKNNLQYWLDWGTLLGSYRHKGFIPWDDDVDLAMMRTDLEKFSKIFNEQVTNKDVYCEPFVDEHNPTKYFLKIRHKKISQISIDIFVMDFYYKKLDLKQKIKMSKYLHLLRKVVSLKKNFNFTVEQQYSRIKDLTRKFILNNKKVNIEDKPDVYFGLDFPHNYKRGFLDYEEVFPLKKVQFENLQLFVPNKDFDVLVAEFKTPMAFPKYMYAHHIDNSQFSNEELELLKKIEEDYNNSKI